MKLKLNQTLTKLLPYARAYKKQMAIILLSVVALSSFAALRPYMVKQVVDVYLKVKDFNGLTLYCLLIGLVLLIEVSSQFFFTYFSNWLGQNIVKDLRNDLFQKITNFKLQFFDLEPVGKLITRNVSDLEAIASIFSQGLFMIISDALKMIVVLLIMLWMNWKLTLIVLISMPVLIYSTKVFQRLMKKTFNEVRTQISNLNTFVQERVVGMKIVQLFTREQIEYEKFKEINQKHNMAWQKNILFNSIFLPIADILSSVTLGCIIIFGGFSIIEGENFTTTGDLFAYTMMISLLFNPLRQIADKFNVMQMGFVAAERVLELMEQNQMNQTQGKQTAPPFNGDISFQNVHFSYTNAVEVLHDINLDIKSGQTIAIVGASGAGKSTIINLLSRFYDISQGKITIDGYNIQNFTLESLRKQIAVVLQEVFLFNSTILENITLRNPDISLDDVIAAAKQIGLHEFIETLPQGYLFNVNEAGLTLSSGQRQLISFLRAYISRPSILILDEATSSVDSHSEALIQQAISILTKGKTSIVIAHRLATIINADCIIVMNKGKIVEKGCHEELMKNPNGYYKNLYEVQFKK